MPDEQDNAPPARPVPLNRARLIGGALDVAGALLLLATLAWSVASFSQVFAAQTVAGVDVARTAAVTIAGLGAAALFLGAGEGLRKLEDIRELFGGAPRGAPGSADASSAALLPRTLNRGGGTIDGDRLDELVGLMREVRDISLMSDAQRAARLQAQADELARRLEREVPELLREHKWFEAFKRVRDARERFPAHATWDALAQQIQAVRGQVEARDIESASRQVNELITLGAWERAADVVRDLLERHPRAAGALELARRVKLQRDKAEAEMRTKLLAQAQECANRRDWINAYNAARSLVQRFPHSGEAEALRAQLPILEANAEVRIRQQMETQIRGLIGGRRYAEALRLARELIERYPNSPQADVLRDQLPRLEEKAHLAR